jgi:4-carboxymuconolactone decarboxylase
MDELTERGLDFFSEIRGAERAADMREAIGKDAFGSAMLALAVGFSFGAVWTRPGLDRKQRSLVTLGILIGLRQTEEFKNHVRIGLTNGLTVSEIEEVLIQAAAYAGFPAAHVAGNAAAQVLRDLEPKPNDALTEESSSA